MTVEHTLAIPSPKRLVTILKLLSNDNVLGGVGGRGLVEGSVKFILMQNGSLGLESINSRSNNRCVILKITDLRSGS